MSNELFSVINSFRSNPSSSQKGINIIAKTMKKMKKNKEGDELETFSTSLKNYKSLPNFILSDGLTTAAKDQLISIKQGKSFSLDKLLAKANSSTNSHSGLVAISDIGEIDNIISRIAISSDDPERKVIKALLDNTYKYLGYASSEYEEDETLSVLVLAKEIQESTKEDYGEDQLLKEAFDLFDVFNTGRLDSFALKDAFESLGLQKSNYSVYKVILNINDFNNKNNYEGVDWLTFRDTVKEMVGDYDTDKGLKKMFNLFVDDGKEDKITAESLKKVASSIGDDITYNDICTILKRACKNGVDINFEEFCKIISESQDFKPIKKN